MFRVLGLTAILSFALCGPGVAQTSQDVKSVLKDHYETSLWGLAETSNDPTLLRLFMSTFPNSPRVALAQAKLETLTPDPQTRQTAEPLKKDGEISKNPTPVKMTPQEEPELATSLEGKIEEILGVVPVSNSPKTLLGETVGSGRVPTEVTFQTPLVFGASAIRGKRFDEVIQSAAIFSPIEGLDESIWKGKTCSTCHSWDRVNLCTQAQTYQTVSFEDLNAKSHPFGGTFKANLKVWGSGNCR